MPLQRKVTLFVKVNGCAEALGSEDVRLHEHVFTQMCCPPMTDPNVLLPCDVSIILAGHTFL